MNISHSPSMKKMQKRNKEGLQKIKDILIKDGEKRGAIPKLTRLDKDS